MDNPISGAYKNNVRSTLLMAAIFLVASGIGYIFHYIRFPDTNIVVIYLLAVLMTAWLARSFVFGFIASILATFLFYYFFTEPIFAFSVNDPYYVVTFVTMTITALITGILTAHVRRSEEEAREKEAGSKAIYNLTNHLTEAADIHDIAGIAVYAISECFAGNAACLCFNEDNTPESGFIQQLSGGKQVQRDLLDPDELKRRIENLRNGWVKGPEFMDWPIYGRENILGVIRIPNYTADRMNEAQMRLLRSMIESTALAMDRLRLAAQRIKSHEETVKERYRANLLRSISHDIRTPLSGIMGTIEMLADMTAREDPRYALILGIQKNVDWLHSMVDNILNLTRLQDGVLPIVKRREAVEEIIGGAVAHMAIRAPEYEISVEAPEELLFVPMDAKLIEQVIINLLDNAVKHTKAGKDIGIELQYCDDSEMVKFIVRDRGEGIHKEDLANIFETFYTSHLDSGDTKQGVGLGLAICETIVKAHGGSIEARNRTDGPGAEFIFTLPMEDKADGYPS